MRGVTTWGLVAGACVGATLALAGSALGRSTADDLSVNLHLSDATTTTSALVKDLQFFVLTDGPAQTVAMRFSLPAGLVFGDDVPDPSDNCTNGATVVCRIALTAENNLRGGWSWPVIASATGRYSITATVEGERPDPNTTNNSKTFTFEIKPAAAGGGAGGGHVAAAVGSAKGKPAKPIAGSPVTFTASVKAGGEPAKPSRVTCAATLGGKKTTGTAKAAAGLASCRYATTRADKGKTLAGSMKVRAGGTTFTKRFSSKLG